MSPAWESALDRDREAFYRDVELFEAELLDLASRGLGLRGAAGSSNSYGAKRLAGGPSEPEAA